MPRNLRFYFTNQLIQIVTEYVYLGIMMSSSAIFRKQMTRANRRAAQVCHTVLKLIFRTKLSNFHSHYTLFESVIKSTLLYGCGVWAQRYKQDLEPIQNNFYRRLLGLHPKLPTAIIRAETGSNHLEISIWEQTLNFLGKIRRMEQTRYAAIIFRRLFQLDKWTDTPEYNWVTQLKLGLRPFGLEDILTTAPEDFPLMYQVSMQIIEEHFQDHDKYLLERQPNNPQYKEFRYDYDQMQPEIQKEEKRTRWARLPWHLQQELEMSTKRFVSQLRQNSMFTRVGEGVVIVPHPSEDKMCLLCNRQGTDCLVHTIFECPVTAVSTADLRKLGWTADNFMKCLDEPCDDIKRVYELVRQCFKTRQFMTAEAEKQ